MVSRPSDIEAWTKLFMLRKCILLLPPYWLRRRGHDVFTLIKERIRCWRDGDYLSSYRSSHFSVSSSSSTQSKAHKARCAVEASHFHKALQALNSNGLALPSPDTRDAILAKHPQSSPPALPPPISPSPVLPSVLPSPLSLPSSSSPPLLLLLSSGSCPPSVIPHLCGATLLASHKKSGGPPPHCHW